MRHLLLRAGIRGKIIAAFALVFCCTAGLGVFAVQRLAAVPRPPCLALMAALRRQNAKTRKSTAKEQW